MPKVKVDFSDVGKVPPDGVYEAVIEKIEYREAKEKGKAPYLNVEYSIVEPEEYAGSKMWEVLSWAPKALFRMKEFFEAAGYQDDEYDLEVDDESNLLIEPDLTGESVELTVENEIYNKKEVNRVVAIEFLNPPGGEVEEDDDAGEDEADAEEADAEDDEAEDESDDEEESEDEAEEEEAPAPRKSTAKTPAAKAAPPKRGFRPTTTGAKKPTAAKKRTFR